MAEPVSHELRELTAIRIACQKLPWILDRREVRHGQTLRQGRDGVLRPEAVLIHGQSKARVLQGQAPADIPRRGVAEIEQALLRQIDHQFIGEPRLRDGDRRFAYFRQRLGHNRREWTTIPGEAFLT